MRRFSHLPHSCIKTCDSSVHSAYIFRHSDQNDLIFFGYFKNILVYYQKVIKKTAQSFLFCHIKSYFLKSKVISSSFLDHEKGPSNDVNHSWNSLDTKM